LRFDGGLALRL
jgi:hypothetical protein